MLVSTDLQAFFRLFFYFCRRFVKASAHKLFFKAFIGHKVYNFIFQIVDYQLIETLNFYSIN